MRLRFHKILTVGLICLVCVQCSSASRQPAIPKDIRSVEELSPAEAYAAEVLSYMMMVVLGQAGNPRYRDDWASRGLNIDLDFSKISEIMGDSTQDKKALLVYDANILGLSEVLYHYNPKLNQFKGRASNVSLYPSSEMVALRILLLQKRHRGERIRIGALLERKPLFLDPDADFGDKDVEDTGLRPEEIRFLQDIFYSEPQLFQHLTCPCLIDTLIQLDVVEKDSLARTLSAPSMDGNIRCKPYGPGSAAGTVKIAILPSLIQEFESESLSSSRYPSGFRPTAFYTEMVDQLVDSIRESLKAALADHRRAEIAAGIHSNPPEFSFEKIWEEKVSVLLEDERPLVIHPANAPAVVEEICPEADLILILTGKDVYLSLDLAPGDVFPSVNRIYLDIMDVRRSQVDSITDEVTEFIMERLFPESSVLSLAPSVRMQ